MGITIYPFWGASASAGSAGASVALSGPVSLYVGQSAQWTITDYDVFREYLVQASAGDISIAGDTIDYTAPATPGEATVTVIADGAPRAVSIEVLPAGIAQPTNVSPVDGATDIGETPTLTSSAFAAIGGSDTHAAARWRIYQGATLVHESDWSAAALTSYAVPSGILSVSTAYAWTVEHRGATLGDSAPSTATGFATAASFFDPYTAAAGTPRAGGFFIGVMTYADGDYELIDAGKASETSLQWKTTSDATSGAASYHDGLANSLAMNNASHPAAQYCLAYAGGGCDDWYLPARDEQELRYRRLKPDATANIAGARPESGSHGENANSNPVGAAYTVGAPGQTVATAFLEGGAEALVSDGTYYWSSTQYAPSTYLAWIQRCSDGRQDLSSKDLSRLVRPVRRLKI